MEDKTQLIAKLREEINRWETLLSGLSVERCTDRDLPSDLSIKDVMGHLQAWQQISNARLDAALRGTDPVYSEWPKGLDPEEERDLEEINAWIHSTYSDRSWPQVYDGWRTGFLHLIDLAEAIPERDLFEKGKYSWLHDYPLSEVLAGTYEHHQIDHYEPLVEWLREHGEIAS